MDSKVIGGSSAKSDKKQVNLYALAKSKRIYVRQMATKLCNATKSRLDELDLNKKKGYV